MSSKEKLLRKLGNREYRDAYAAESVLVGVPFQVRALREQRGWSQQELGKRAGMQQAAVSRLESSEYGRLSVNTLIRLCNAFDCALMVKFVPFSRLVRETQDLSMSALEVCSFDDDKPHLNAQVKRELTTDIELGAANKSKGMFYVNVSQNWKMNSINDHRPYHVKSLPSENYSYERK